MSQMLEDFHEEAASGAAGAWDPGPFDKTIRSCAWRELLRLLMLLYMQWPHLQRCSIPEAPVTRMPLPTTSSDQLNLPDKATGTVSTDYVVLSGVLTRHSERKNATITIKTKKIVNVLILYLYYFPVIFRLPEFGLQRNHFFRDFSKLKFYRPELPFYNFFVQGKHVLKSLSSKLQELG